MSSGRFLLCWGNRHRDLCHVGCGVVADDVVDQGNLARGPGGCQVALAHIAEQLLIARACLPCVPRKLMVRHRAAGRVSTSPA